MSKKNTAVEDDDLDFSDGAVFGDDIAEDDLEVEIEDDTPEEDRNRPVAPDVSDDEDDAEMAEYTKAQDRIDFLTKKRHDERHAKEGALRERDAALDIARRAQAALNEANKRTTISQTAAIAAAKDKAKGDLESLKAQLKEATELGDGAKMGDLMEQIASTTSRVREAEIAEEQLKTAAPVTVNDVQTQPNRPQVSDRQEKWNKENTWFGPNKRMTAFALGLHEELVEEGLVPETEKYYNRINSEMRKTFPDAFQQSERKPRSAAPPVAGVTRKSSSGKTVVRLTESERKVAKSLGVSEKAYALMKVRGSEIDND